MLFFLFSKPRNSLVCFVFRRFCLDKFYLLTNTNSSLICSKSSRVYFMVLSIARSLNTSAQKMKCLFKEWEKISRKLRDLFTFTKRILIENPYLLCSVWSRVFHAFILLVSFDELLYDKPISFNIGNG